MKNTKNIMCLSWCNADNVMNYGQILQGLAMMYNLRNITDGTIIYASYLPRKFKNKIRCAIERYNPFNGHLNAYIRTKKIIKKIMSEYNIKLVQVSKYKNIYKWCKDCDILICGSDQIWHPSNYDKGYFLDFGKDNQKRVAYAASLPKTHIEGNFYEEFKKIKSKLSKFDAIAVREKGSVEFISNLSGKKVEHVLDPTYLVPKNIWEKYINKIKVPEKYIFVYIPNGMDEKINCILEKIKKEYKVDEVILLMTRGKNEFKNTKQIKYVDLGQFLYLIKNAKCVLTSSFHAVVFSSILNVDFFCYDVLNKERGEDIRLSDILKILGLEKRLITDNIDNYMLNESIDYKSVENKLEIYRKESKSFLLKTI